MTFTGFEAALKERFPGAFTHMLPTPFKEGEFLSFEVLVADGVAVRGTATIPVEECGCITLRLVSAGEAAPFVQWLLDDFIPSPDLIRFSSEGAMEIGDETHWELPLSGVLEEIEEDLRAHISYVENA